MEGDPQWSNCVGEWSSVIPISQQEIPLYDAEEDGHCKYTDSQAFKQSPYYKLKLHGKHGPGEGRQEAALVGEGYTGETKGFWLGRRGRPDVSKFRLAALDELLPPPGRKARDFTRFTFLELEAMKAVFHREALVNGLREKTVKFQDVVKREGRRSGCIDGELAEVLTPLVEDMCEIRSASLMVLESIAKWRKQMRTETVEERPPQLTWKGSNYLLRMTVDLNFLGHAFTDTDSSSLKEILGLPLLRNPFCLPLTLDDMIDIPNDYCLCKSELVVGASGYSHAWCERLVSASRMLLEEERFFGRISLNERSTLPALPPESGVVYTEEKLKLFNRMITKMPIDTSVSDKPVSRDDSMVGRRLGTSNLHESVSDNAGLLYMAKLKPSRNRPRAAPLGTSAESGPSVYKDASGIRISKKAVVELRHSEPTPHAFAVLKAVYALLFSAANGIPPEEPISWRFLVTSLLRDSEAFLNQLASFSSKPMLSAAVVDYMKPIFTSAIFHPDTIRPVNKVAAVLCSWCIVKAGPQVLAMNTTQELSSSVNKQLDSLRSELNEIKQQVKESQVGHPREQITNTILSLEGMNVEQKDEEDLIIRSITTEDSLLVAAPLVSKLLGRPLSVLGSEDKRSLCQRLLYSVTEVDGRISCSLPQVLYRGVHRKKKQIVGVAVERVTMLKRSFAVRMKKLNATQAAHVSFVSDIQLHRWFTAMGKQKFIKGLVDWQYFPSALRCFLHDCIQVSKGGTVSISATIPCPNVSVDGYSVNAWLIVTTDGNYDVHIKWKARRMKLELSGQALAKDNVAFPPRHWQELFNCLEFDDERCSLQLKQELSRYSLVPANAIENSVNLVFEGGSVNLNKLLLSKLKRKRKRRRKARKSANDESLAMPEEEDDESKATSAGAEVEKQHQEVFLDDNSELPYDFIVTPGSTACTSSSIEVIDELSRGNKVLIERMKYVVRKVEQDDIGEAVLHLETPYTPNESISTPSDSASSPSRLGPTAPRRARVTKVHRVPTTLRKLEGSVSISKDTKYLKCAKDLRYDVRPGHHLRLDGKHLVQLSSRKEDTFEEFCLTLSENFTQADIHKARVELVLPKPQEASRFSIKRRTTVKRDKRRETMAQSQWLKKKEELATTQIDSFFGYKMKWGHVRSMLGVGERSKQMKDYIKVVSKDTALHAMFLMMCQDWLPAASMLDGNKFAKFIKELPNLLNEKLTPTHVDLIFAKIKNQGERRIDFEAFYSQALQTVAQERFPWLSPEEALQEILSKHVYVWEGFKAVVKWEALQLAVHDEGLQHCGALKIQSAFRGYQAREYFNRHVKAAKSIQRAYFAFAQRSLYKQALRQLREGRDLKIRQTMAKRQARKHAKLYAQAKIISGVVNIVTIYKHSKGAVRLTIYNPKSSESFTYIVLPDDLKGYAEVKYGAEDLVGDQLYEERVLLCLVERLAYRKRQGRRAVVIGRSTITEKGEVALVQGRYLRTNTKKRQLHIIKILEYRGNYCFHAYDPRTQQTKTVDLKIHQLHRWFGYDKCDAEPELLKQANRTKLHYWFLDRLYICASCALQSHRAKHKLGESILMLEFEVIEQRENLMAARIQGLFRNRQARVRVRELICTVYKKQKHLESGKWFYVNKLNGVVSWTKPLLLGKRDLPDPPNMWEQVTDAEGDIFYFNAFTGRTSWLSEEDAARIVQQMYRSKEGAVFKIKDISQIVTALKFQVKAEVEYERNPNKLAAIVNYAMLIFTRDHDLEGTKPLLMRALEAAPNNPLILRIVGLYELAACEYPRPQKFEEALERIEFANSIDKECLKFMTAFNAFFYWSIVANPSSAKSFLNYALVQQCIFRDYDKAQKFYRRALDLDPDDLKIVQNYNDFLENRLPAGRFEGGGPGLKVRKRAVVVEHFGEWQKCQDPEMPDPRFATFWFNDITQQTQWAEPDWDLVWLERRNRSTMLHERLNWVQFKDPYKSTIFYYNYSLKQYTFDPPNEFI